MGKILPGNRTTVLLLLAAVGVTIYAGYFEVGRPVWSGAAKVFDSIQHADIVGLEIIQSLSDDEAAAGAGNRRIALERRGEYEWNLTEPVRFRGFVPRIQGILWELVDMVKVIELPPDSEAARGWCEETGPSVTVRFKTRQGEKHSIAVGRQHAGLKDDLYVQLDGETIIVTRSTARSIFSASLEELRSKALVPVAPADCAAFSISGSREARKAFRREEKTGRWRFAEGAPLAGLLADRRKTAELLTTLNSWKIKRFIQPQDVTGEFLMRCGLDKPRLKLDVEHRRGDRIVLELGSAFEKDGEGFVWLRATEGGFVFSAADGPVKRLLEEAGKYQTAAVFDFEGVEFAEVLCRGRGGSFVIRPVAGASVGRGAGGWLVEDAGKNETFRGDRQIVPEAVSDLRNLLIEKFFEPAAAVGEGEGAAPGLGEITVKTETGESHTLRLLRRSADPRDAEVDAFVAERSGDRSRFLVISRWPGRLEFGAAVFRERAISELAPGNVAELVVSRGKTSWVLAHLAGTWSFSNDQVVLLGKKLDGARVNKVVEALRGDRFRVVSFAPGFAKESWEEVGVGTHNFHLRLQLRSFLGEHKGFRKITVGTSQSIAGEDGLRYGRVDSFSAPFVLQPGFPVLLEELASHLAEITGEP